MTVYLGNCLGSRENRLAWAAMLLGVREVAVLPHAVRPDRHEVMRSWCWSQVRRSGSLAHVRLVDTVPLRQRGRLLLLPGGNTYELLAALRAHDGLRGLRELVEAGGRVYAGSAGALVLGRSIAGAAAFDEDTVGTDDLRGADVLGGLSVLPHWEAEQEGVLPVAETLAMPDRSFAVIGRAGSLRSLGRRPVRVRGTWLSPGRSCTLRHPS